MTGQRRLPADGASARASGHVRETRGERGPSLFGRLTWRIADLLVRAATVVTDAVPPHHRFGLWMRLVDLLAFGQTLPRIPHREPAPGPVRPAPSVEPAPRDVRCLLVAGGLDNGGIETVVATLALGLGRHGVAVEVVCASSGRTAEELVRAGVPVTVVPTAALADLVESRDPDVIQLHRVDPDVVAALTPQAHRTVPVFHAMESYLDAAGWRTLDTLMAECPAAMAVSESAREFFAARYPDTSIDVVVNGVESPELATGRDIADARARLAAALGVAFEDEDRLVVSLQRFSDQKNPRGLVDAFLLASEADARLRLVVAGATNSWLEVRRADVLRRLHPRGSRVHFLGDSDAQVVLRAGDIFALDSFAEGGPVAAVEAAACGLPVVLSDVGFARELVAASEAKGVLVPRANADMSARTIARARRARTQANRDSFAAGLLEAASLPRTAGGIPTRFRKETMIAGHAAVLRSVVETTTRIALRDATSC
ncbi:glycosyltransferase [Xylanimonas allomyrinae]|uniref:Glycosyltransferase n=1 Tax=Xylanimonas allomyrinae TaxID=2509459 RepID=A0A4P6EHG0_9MICO|nr:glycosyltransferase [Xylanimonas allomyrinae]QAY61960.1 glycosyltransferase [Xylanimonas allomyrinae]